MLFTRRILVCCAFFSLIVFPAAAQFKAAIQGTITDATGAAVANSKVTLTSTETHREQ